ncbi:organic cation transporter protein-like [Pectinophora gossypiella]|uniref:organic cation transporter protein-like n=1 Tax=Pectinophora gossypiella TaxID=13191 RepID=UPI00214E13BF|nr:organic cation transporter protein-like [Pectinophora gossypiella]
MEKTEETPQEPEIEKSREESSQAVDLDRILIEELGQFGLYQLRGLLLAIVVVVFGAWAAVEYIFTTARIETRCLIPVCENAATVEFSPSWLGNAVPLTDSGRFDNCQRFANTSATDVTGTCPALLFNQNNVISCEEYVYANAETVVYDYDLACDEWRRSLIGSVRTVGVLLAMPLTGYVSDRWGRRTALVLNAVNTAWLGAIRYFANTYIGFLISQFTEAMFGAGGFNCTYILVMELMGPKYRVAAGATLNTFFAVGQVTMGLIAWGVPTWRQLTLALYVPQFITISYIWIMAESVRWYMSKGRYEESEKVLLEVARVNKKTLSMKSLEALRESAEEEKRRQELAKAQKAQEPLLLVQLWRNKRVLLRCCVSPVWWITTTFIYYGLSINSVNMSGNKYLNYVAVSAVEIPGFWTSFLLMGIVGRKPVLIGAFWICAACQVAYIFMPNNLYGVSLTVYLIGKYAIAMVMTAVYVYTAELYHTKHRNTLFAFASMMGRIGAIVAPLTPAFGAATFEQLPFVLFGGFALVAGLLVLLTPETLGTKFPDTIEEANDMGRTKNTS